MVYMSATLQASHTKNKAINFYKTRKIIEAADIKLIIFYKIDIDWLSRLYP